MQGCRECVHPPVVDLLLLAPQAGFLPRLGLGLFMRGAAGGGSNEVLAPAPLSLLHAHWEKAKKTVSLHLSAIITGAS